MESRVKGNWTQFLAQVASAHPELQPVINSVFRDALIVPT
jgi:hypothetical protein